MYTTLNKDNHILQHPVRWGDMDALDHVNNTVYFRYLEEARVNYFEESGLRSLMREMDIGFILAYIDCKFKFPLTYPDTIFIETSVTEKKSDRFSLKQVIYSDKHQKIAAQGSSVVVSYDHKNKQKVLLPDQAIQLLLCR